MPPMDAPSRVPPRIRFRRAVSGFVQAPGFPLWVSVGLHAVFVLAAASVKSSAPGPESEPPEQPISISFEDPPPSFSFVEPPMVIDFVEFAVPEPPIFDAEDDAVEELEEIETEPAPEALASVEIPIPVEAIFAEEEHDERREEELATDTASAPSESESDKPQDEEQAALICPPEFLSGENRSPKYPRLARKRRYEGEVVLEIEVLADGSSGRIDIVRSSGHVILDEAAVEAARTWRFMQAKGGMSEASSLVRVPVVFRLE